MLYTSAYSQASLTVAVALALAVMHMGNAPASARLSIVSIRASAVINTLWAVFVATAGTVLMFHGGSAGLAMTIYLAAHTISSFLVLLVLARRDSLPQGMALTFALATRNNRSLGRHGSPADRSTTTLQPDHRADARSANRSDHGSSGARSPLPLAPHPRRARAYRRLHRELREQSFKEATPMSPELQTDPRQEIAASPASGLAGQDHGESSIQTHHRSLNVLAYVHLRNIHASTGAGRVARQLTEHLARRSDISLRVLADAADRARILPLVGEPWQSFRYHTFTAETSRQQAWWFALNRPAAERFWPEADIVFCTGEAYVPTQKARLVVTAHDAAYFEPGAHRQDGAFWRQRLKWKLLFRRLSARADMIHTVSHFSAERLAHFFPALASRIRVVHNAVTPHFFDTVPESGRAFVREQGLSDRPFVLIPGGLHFRKNADLILAAAPRLLSQHPDLVLAIVNHSDPEYATRAAALSARVRLLGFVSESALHALYAAATIVWFPSLYEGFGLPVLEAMAVGAPVVASNASSLPEIAGHAALLADARNPSDHVERLSTLLEDETLRGRLAALGQAHARKFNWERSAAQLRGHFETLL